MPSLVLFVAGMLLGMGISLVTGYKISNWQWWAIFIPFGVATITLLKVFGS